MQTCMYTWGMRKDITIPVRASGELQALLKRAAKNRGFADGRGDGVSALVREWFGIFGEMERSGAWDSLTYLSEKMGKTPEVVLAGILNARAKELLDKE